MCYVYDYLHRLILNNNNNNNNNNKNHNNNNDDDTIFLYSPVIVCTFKYVCICQRVR
jgi:hypothetical protein